MPPQPDHHDALDGGRTQTTERESRDRGCSRVRGKDRQKELNRARARSKSWKHSKSRKRSKSLGRARAGKGPRAVGAIRPRRATGTRCGNPESGPPNVGGRNPASPLATP